VRRRRNRCRKYLRNYFVRETAATAAAALKCCYTMPLVISCNISINVYDLHSRVQSRNRNTSFALLSRRIYLDKEITQAALNHRKAGRGNDD